MKSKNFPLKGLAVMLAMLGFCGCQFVRRATKFHDPIKEFETQQEEKHKQLLTAAEGGRQVRILKDDPPKDFVGLGPITASDGGSNGTRGVKGTYDRAVVVLKAKAIGMGADYVQVMQVQPPHYEPAETNMVIRALTPSGCPDPQKFIYSYEISGNAFKAP